MKKKVLLLILILQIFCFIYCYSIIKRETPSNYIVDDNALVNMSIKDKTLSNTQATVILSNYDNITYEYGDGFVIEYKKGNTWYQMKQSYKFNTIAIAYSILPNEEKELVINWKDIYGTLSNGTYRIIKNFNNKYVAAYFTLNK